MEILNQFGFDLKLFIGQIVNFLILFYLFKRFLYKPVRDVLAERQNRIRQGLEDSEKARVMLEQSRQEGAEMLKATRIEAEKIIENARSIAEQMRQDIAAQARAESEKIIAQSRAQAALEMEKMQGSVRYMSVDLSQKILLQVLQSVFSEEEKSKIMKRAVQQIVETGGGQGSVQ
jgi:F-type H+-transporting ATPase subunit b